MSNDPPECLGTVSGHQLAGTYILSENGVVQKRPKGLHRSQQRCTPEPPPLEPPSRTGLGIGCVLSQDTTRQHSPAGLVTFSGREGGTFLRVPEMRNPQPFTPTTPAERAPPTLRGRPMGHTMASARLCRPRAAPAAVSGPVPSAITAISGISGPDQVERGGPRGLRCRSCATPPRWAAIPRSQFHARALRAAPPLSEPRFPQTEFFEVVDS
jgi:hypothetical protein